MKSILYFISIGLALMSCQNMELTQKQFSSLNPDITGIYFSNDIQETDSLNYFTYPYMYMGGGIAAGDINNDGLVDLFFTANMKSNKLYLNKGGLKFEDITDKAKMKGDNRWFTGATMVDINNDGFLDIYTSVSGKEGNRKNLLYVNNGDLTFTESSESYGIAHDGHTTQATFFDYDKDGYLDLYLANYPPTKFNSPVDLYSYRLNNPIIEASDILYHNNGDGTFSNVTIEAGILNFGLALSATAGDFNNDGWPDIYVSNDFDSPDFFYQNQQDGTFKEVSRTVLQHTSQYGMGVDIADYNNDNLLDFGQMDMTPEDNKRSKANMGSMNPSIFNKMVDYGLFYQYMQNSLQLNRGIDDTGELKFSEVSRISGIATTDWSWAILFSDLDNDGWKDIFISNGSRRDINNKDYFKKLSVKLRFDQKLSSEEIAHIPSEKISNYVYANNKDYTFKNVTEAWGMDDKTFSNGAVYTDLDNDGDLDIVINNIDEMASIYKNNNLDNNNYIKIKLEGSLENTKGIGSRVYIMTEDNQQMQELTLSRGFQSSVAPEFHFGLAENKEISTLKIVWPDGKTMIKNSIPANQTIKLNYNDADFTEKSAQHRRMFKTVASEKLSVDFVHNENQYNDFEKEVLLPHKTSMLGPGIAVADVNNDGLEDFYVGGAANQNGCMYLQTQEGTFKKTNESVWLVDKNAEDMSAVFFDANGDNYMDLYVVSGGNEFGPLAPELQDRLYMNDGLGGFSKVSSALPSMPISGSRAVPGDFDNDGDIDLIRWW